MTYVHLAHDCHVGDDVVIANGTQFAGHVTVHDRAVLSGLNAVHQFVTIGTLRLRRRRVAGQPGHPAVRQGGGQPDGAVRAQLGRVAARGLLRRNVAALKRAYRLFFNSELNLSQALERARADLPPFPEVEHFLEFVASSERGVPA